ncbi:MAG TPA: glycosyltransferase family 39 protein, partial [Pyrinomonadaceae bacterium]|nr:glycosyltransferase family 39 protein [Pyrinomonadaceae bacterium]
VGFAEDEINKLDAVASYRRGDITANAEHPMLMKSLMFVSVEAARAWNAVAPAASRVSDEAALRLPNVLFGALTVVPLYLLAACFFERRTALLAAAFWAVGVNAITYNRIAKEDTLLVFFVLLATYFYVRAKKTSGFEAARKRRFYILSGASFGLMLASKYFPHYFGLVMLYQHLVPLRQREPGEPRGTTPRVFFVVIFVAFLAANPAILLPQTWEYLRAYAGEELLTHHGYLMGERLYDNVMSKTPFGATPVYFYLLFLAIKVPLAILAAAAIGLCVAARRWREPGPAFLLLMTVLWVVPFSLAGAKWLRYALSLMPLVYMLAAVGVVWLVRRGASLLKGRDGQGSPHAPAVVGALAVVVFVAAPAVFAYRAMPHYALYTNALGAGRAGHFFPHDEFYDDGLREAIARVAESAPRGSTLAHETPGVARHYLARFGRTDIESRVISDPRFDARDTRGTTYFILQRGRTYFENREELEAVRRAGRKEHEVFVRGASAAEVYVVGAALAARE